MSHIVKKKKNSIVKKKKNSIVKKKNIESECTKNREDKKVKICPITYDELGKNGEYILKDHDNGYCFNYNSIIDKKTGDFRPYMDKNPMNKKEWSETFKNTLFTGIPKRIALKLIRKNGLYQVEGKDRPCCTKCKLSGWIPGFRKYMCKTCGKDFKSTDSKEPCHWWLSTKKFGRSSRKRSSRKRSGGKRGGGKRGSKKKRKRHCKKNTKKRDRKKTKRKHRKTKKRKFKKKIV